MSNTENDKLQTEAVTTFDDIRARKRIVRQQIRHQEAEMKQYMDALFADYHTSQSLLSVQGVRKVTTWVGGAMYAFRILRSISRVTGILRRR